MLWIFISFTGATGFASLSNDIFEWRKLKMKKGMVRGKQDTFTHLWTLSQLLTFSYDVVRHDNKGRVSLRIQTKVFFFFFASVSHIDMQKNAYVTRWIWL